MTHTESHFENEPTARFEIDPCTRPLNPHLTHLVKLERSKTLLIRFCFQYLETSCAPTIRVRNPGSSHSLCTAAAQAGETVFADRAIRVNALCPGPLRDTRLRAKKLGQGRKDADGNAKTAGVSKAQPRPEESQAAFEAAKAERAAKKK